ncbi:hypothetical protein [Thermincola potens]|uniref:Permease n=1 Tax=Thermincola potens (strain JR) TaxID=635013 RepID=D5XDZ4_THEPJ|nr:hypothetical protein [Thermincola potens]ADG81865.1 conserved hypothetical protein [Thermincola potens JR]
MSGAILYGLAIVGLLYSFAKDRKKTKMAVLKAWKSFANLAPQLLAILMFVGISLAILSPATISRLMGEKSGIIGIIIASVVGSVTLIPGFVAFPLAAALLKGGAGYPQIAAFVSTLMAVGIVTLPTEIKYFNKTVALLRNSFAFLVAMIFTVIISRVMM